MPGIVCILVSKIYICTYNIYMHALFVHLHVCVCTHTRTHTICCFHMLQPTRFRGVNIRYWKRQFHKPYWMPSRFKVINNSLKAAADLGRIYCHLVDTQTIYKQTRLHAVIKIFNKITFPFSIYLVLEKRVKKCVFCASFGMIA